MASQLPRNDPSPQAAPSLLLFGATHALGHPVIQSALTAGYAVAALRPKGLPSVLSYPHSSVETREADFSDAATYRDLLAGRSAVIYLEGLESRLRRKPASMAERLLKDREQLLRAAAEQSVPHVVILGDADLFAPGAGDSDFAVETNPISGRGYGRAYRLIWDQFRNTCRETGLGTRVHPGKVYGPMTWFQREIVDAAKFNGRVALTRPGDHWITPVHVQDAVQGLLLAAGRGAPDTDILLGGEPVRCRDFVQLTLRYMGIRFSPTPVPAWWRRWQWGLMETEARLISCRIQSETARQLGWTPAFALLKEGLPQALKALGTLAWG